MRQYREAMLDFSGREPARSVVRTAGCRRADRAFRHAARRRLAASCSTARSRGPAQDPAPAPARKLTEMVDGQPRFTSAPPAADAHPRDLTAADAHEREFASPRPVRPVPGHLHADRQHLVRSYRLPTWRARWSAWAASARAPGSSCWSPATAGDVLVLQAKQAQPSVLEPFLGASEYATHGERVVRGQRMMQAATDIFLSWQRSVSLDGVERDYYVRQFWDWKASADLSRMTEHGLLTYTRACAWSLARSHARSGDRLAIAAYLGKGAVFERADRPVLRAVRRPERARLRAPPPGRRRRRGAGAERLLSRAVRSDSAEWRRSRCRRGCLRGAPPAPGRRSATRAGPPRR